MNDLIIYVVVGLLPAFFIMLLTYDRDLFYSFIKSLLELIVTLILLLLLSLSIGYLLINSIKKVVEFLGTLT